MTVWGALIGGFVGTLVLTTILRAASELRITRIDLPFLLGTMVTPDRKRAKALGTCCTSSSAYRSRSGTSRSSSRSDTRGGWPAPCSACCTLRSPQRRW